MVSASRSADGASARARSATSTSRSGSRAAAWASANSTASVQPEPDATRPLIQSISVSLSRTAPSAMACSSPCDQPNMPTGNAGDSQVSRRRRAPPSVMVMMVAMVVTVVMVPMIVRPMRAAIGAALGIERRDDPPDRRAEMLEHVGDDVVVADQQAVAADLGRQMPVAEMPGERKQMLGALAGDLEQGFRRGQHRQNAAVLQRQTVAVAQLHRFGQVEQEGKAVVAGQPMRRRWRPSWSSVT